MGAALLLEGAKGMYGVHPLEMSLDTKHHQFQIKYSDPPKILDSYFTRLACEDGNRFQIDLQLR